MLGGYRTVLGSNEPNKADQANMNAGHALDLWPSGPIYATAKSTQ